MLPRCARTTLTLAGLAALLGMARVLLVVSALPSSSKCGKEQGKTHPAPHGEVCAALAKET